MKITNTPHKVFDTIVMDTIGPLPKIKDNTYALATILTQVEACLKSRPLASLSDDHTELNAITPGNFLIGEAPALPEPNNLTEIQTNRLNRWELVQQMTQIFWKRWKDEYLMTLIHRTKWQNEQRNVQTNDLIVVRDDNISPTKWKLARVLQTYPGKDGLVRSVKIKTSTGEYERPIVKLGLLLSVEEQNKFV